jgi:endoglucanase
MKRRFLPSMIDPPAVRSDATDRSPTRSEEAYRDAPDRTLRDGEDRVFVCFLLAAAAFVGCDAGTQSCLPGTDRVKGDCLGASPVQLNTVGFLPDRTKRATVASSATTFSVLRADGSSAYRGALEGPLDGDVGKGVFVADFSPLTEAGDFTMVVDEVGKSPVFRIGADAFVGAFQTAMLGLYGQRCGTDVHLAHDGDDFSHAACHGDDAYLDYLTGSSARRASVGGWHDAGDYGKYVGNGAFSAAVVLKAAEHFKGAVLRVALAIPEHGGALPDVLAETKWELDWLRTVAQQDGSVPHKVTALNFESLHTNPDEDNQKRYYAPIGTAATADLAAVMALAARIYEPYDSSFADECLGAAKLSYSYLTLHTADEAPDLGAFKTGGYETSDDDDRMWAAAELWETTGDAATLTDFEARAQGNPAELLWDWGDVRNLALFTYALSERSGRDDAIVQAVQAGIVSVADEGVANSSAHGYGRGVGPAYYWGINGAVVRTTMALQVANRLHPTPAYLDAAVQQIDHVLGRNSYGRSQVTGLGYHPPLHPHHRPSIADRVAEPWPGLLVGGPWPDATSWTDDQNDYEHNEVAVNWNAALVYALAGFLPTESG